MTVTDCEVLGGDGGPGIPNQLDRCPLQAYAVESMLKPTIVTRVVPLQRNLGPPVPTKIEAGEARRWKERIYGLMLLWGLEPKEVLGPLD